ncbi:hypothetical protein C2E23DRAFT_443829 [Lenzites betulinus]|nr:hypothetical protein C2E23DRAFT_443829 [Lenzites betulinus]
MSTMLAVMPISTPHLYVVSSRIILAPSNINQSGFQGDLPYWVVADAQGHSYGAPDVSYAAKLKREHNHAWQKLVGLNPHGDVVHDPTELPERRPSPIGSRRRTPSAISPTAQPPPARALTPMTADARGLREASHGPRPARPCSAPPSLQRKPLPALPEEDEKRPEVTACPVFPAAEIQKSKHARHLPADCEGDPLCAAHRKRPARAAGPHARAPLRLWEKRPKFGQRQCNDFDCTDRRCVDCAYLRSRGSALWMQFARPGVEERLRELDVFASSAEYAEHDLALLRLRATFQVRRTMG